MKQCKTFTEAEKEAVRLRVLEQTLLKVALMAHNPRVATEKGRLHNDRPVGSP